MGNKPVMAGSGREGELAAGVGRVRRLAFVSILRKYSSIVPHMRTIDVLAYHIFSPQSVMARRAQPLCQDIHWAGSLSDISARDEAKENQGGLSIASSSLMTIVFFPESGSRSVTISLIVLSSISSSCFFKMSCPAENSA